MVALAPREALLLGSMACSFGTSVVLLVLWRHVLAPAIPRYAGRSTSDRIFLSSAFVSLLNSAASPVFAVLAIVRLPWGALGTSMEPSDAAVRAVGLSCGYMLYDSIYCAVHREMRNPLMLGHHMLPVIFWPCAAPRPRSRGVASAPHATDSLPSTLPSSSYCILHDRLIPIILFFVLTELTNVGQHGRIMMLKLGLDGAPPASSHSAACTQPAAVRTAPSVAAAHCACARPSGRLPYACLPHADVDRCFLSGPHSTIAVRPTHTCPH
jgi:hypothetical protein